MNSVCSRHVSACLLCVFLVLASAVSCYAVSYTTESFYTTLDVDVDSSMHVTEEISVNFDSPAHGIYRYINSEGSVYFMQDGELTESPMLYSIKNIECRGEEVSSELSEGYEVVRIGSADRTVTGEKTYVLEYDIVMYRDELEDFDHLYWNIMPAGWETEVGYFGFTVNMPKAFDEDEVYFVSGALGEAETGKCSYAFDGNSVTGRYDGILPANEGVTVRIMLPEGYWEGAKDDSFKLAAIMAVEVLITAFMCYLFLRYGRDKKAVKTVEFYPPDGLSSAEIGYIYDEKLQMKDMVSLVMWFASKGFIKISRQKGRGGLLKNSESFTLTKTAELPGDAPSYQRSFFYGLFSDGDVVSGDSPPIGFGDSLEAAMDSLKAIYLGRGKTLTDPSSARASATGAVAAIMLVVVSFGGCVALKLSGAQYGAAFGVFAVCAVIVLIMQIFMTRPSDYRTEILGRIRGFMEFIQKAELDRINALVEQDPDYFYDILPYAYVFGLTDKWAKHFEGLALEAPGWYDAAGSDAMFVPAVFCRSFERTVGESISAALPKVSASSFSGGSSGGGGGGFSGGGFSGGGGGGGGGGAW